MKKRIFALLLCTLLLCCAAAAAELESREKGEL